VAAPTHRFTMMPATRDAITKLFERPGRVLLERDEQGRYWAGLPNRRGTIAVHQGKTIVEAVETAIASPDTAPVSLEEASR
jgi:hypothetical protein